MTRIDFYLLGSEALEPRLLTVCRLTEKAVTLGQRVHVHADDEALLDRLDALLWQFRATSFVPHVRLQAGMSPADHAEEPVHLANIEPGFDRQVLINLADVVPPFFSRFERTLEVLNEQTDVRALGRERFRFYRERGYPLYHHQL